MEKAFQQLTPDDTRSLVIHLREIRHGMSEFSKMARQDKHGFFKSAPPNFYWADFYSDSLETMMKKLNYLVDEEGQLENVFQNGFLLGSLGNVELKVRDMGKGVEYSQYVFICLQVALCKSLEALQLYGKSVNCLVYEALNGEPWSLFDAVKIDRSVVSNKEVARLLASAELRDDKAFMKKLGRSFINRSKKKTHGLNELRFVVACLHEMGHLQTMSVEDRYQLLAKDLSLYSAANDDPASLNRLINRMNLTSRT